MVLLKTAKDVEIECDSVVRGSQYPVLHIYTDKITPVEAYELFGDPEHTSVLTATETKLRPVEMEDGSIEYVEEKITKKYEGFTDIFSVQKAQLYTKPGEILIWLQKPQQE